MRQAKTADLKNNLSRYLAYVREGGEVVVLDRDTPVARLVPFDRGATAHGSRAAKEPWEDERLVDLERHGLLTRGNPGVVHEWLRTRRPVKLPRGSGSVVRELLDMRDEDTR